jgi:hypothetical protein
MGCYAEFFLVYSRIQLTIQKSVLSFQGLVDYSVNCRVLIATIKDMGLCPCLRCLTQKSMFAYLGLLKDMKSRLNNLQVYVETYIIMA